MLLGLFWRLKHAMAGPPRFATIDELRRAVMAAMAAEFPDATIAPDIDNPAKFKTTLPMGDDASFDADVSNLFNRLRAYPEENSSELIDGFIAGVSEAIGRTSRDQDLLVVLRSVGDQRADEEVFEPFVGDLELRLRRDLPHSLITVGGDDLNGMSFDQAKQIALSNVRKWLPKVAKDEQLGAVVYYGVQGNEILSPSLILLDEFWVSIRDRFPGDVLIAVPRRDQLFIADTDHEGRALAKRLIEITFMENFSLLSKNLYARRGGKIVLEKS